MEYIKFKIGLFFSIISCILLSYCSGFLYDFLYEKIGPSIVNIDGDCKSIKSIDFFVTILEDGSISINTFLLGDDGLIGKLVDNCSYLNINSEDQITYVGISEKNNLFNLIDQNINYKIIGGNIPLYQSLIKICGECSSGVIINAASIILRKTYAVRLLKLRINFSNKNRRDKIPSNLYIRASHEANIVNLNKYTNKETIVHKNPDKYYQYTLFYTGESNSIDIDASYSNPTNERFESIILSFFGTLLPIGIGFVAEGGIEYCKFKKREKEKRNHES